MLLLPVGTADPGIVHHGGAWYSVSTSGCDRGGSVPVRRSTNLKDWQHLRHVIREGERPAWIGACDFWAPEVHEVSGRWICYYSARGHDRRFRVGAAVADRPAGPYRHLSRPVAEGRDCSIIDASFFLDPVTGRPWLLFKEDRNDLRPKEPTPIILEPLSEDGITTTTSAQNPAHVILVNDRPWEGHLVEAPQIVVREGWYYLFFSGNDFSGDAYGVGVARARSVTGPYEKFAANPILTSSESLTAIGHSFVLEDGGRWRIFYHARERSRKHGNRFLMMDELAWDDGWPRVEPLK